MAVLMRHLLGVYQSLPDFPRVDDIYFELATIAKVKGNFTYSEVRPLHTFKITKTKWTELMDELVEMEEVEKIKKGTYKLIEIEDENNNN